MPILEKAMRPWYLPKGTLTAQAVCMVPADMLDFNTAMLEAIKETKINFLKEFKRFPDMERSLITIVTTTVGIHVEITERPE